MRVCKEGATWKLRGGDRGDGEDEGDREVGGKKKLTCSFLDPPRKPSPCFLTTPQKRKNPFFRQLIKMNQYN